VLAVGDAQFQKKCLGKMQDVGKEGRTVLFVSHNMPAVSNLCTRCLLLDQGAIQLVGNTEVVLNKYIEYGMANTCDFYRHTLDTMPGDDVVRLSSVKLSSEGKVTSAPLINADIDIVITYINLVPDKNICLSIHLNDKYDNCVFAAGNLPGGSTVPDPWGGTPHPVGTYVTTCKIPSHFLNNGLYRISVFLISDVTCIHLHMKDIITFDVQDNTERDYLGEIIGAVRPRLYWNTAFQQSPDSLELL
jgi:lipopolysaccharide transport system ATP-binding protein